MRQQPFASPEEALEHFGIKGMRWGIRKVDDPNAYIPADGLGHGSQAFSLKHPKRLRVDHSNGFADVVPAKGIPTAKGRQNHDEMVASLKQARETYPAVAKLKVEVVPFSSIQFNPGRSAQAGVMHGKSGEIFVAYNDTMKDHSARKVKSWEKWVPGTKYPGYVGQHEMGHVIAIANKLTPPNWDAVTEPNPYRSIDKIYSNMAQDDANHRAAFVKHGLSFQEVSKLSPYAATSPAEAYAELAGNYHTPQTRKRMSPELSRKAKALFEDSGGS